MLAKERDNIMRTLYTATAPQLTGEAIKVSALSRLDAMHQATYCFSAPLAMIQVEPCLPAIIHSRSAYSTFTEPDDSIII
jgi:hypothetical protein